MYALQATCGGRLPSRATQPDVVRHLSIMVEGRVLMVASSNALITRSKHWHMCVHEHTQCAYSDRSQLHVAAL